MTINADIEKAAQLILEGTVVAIPTETVYGLGADATNDDAVKKIFQIKNRPNFNPLIVHVANLAHAQAIGHIPEKAIPLLEAHWPGPLTIVVPLRSDTDIALTVSAGLKTIALRVPNHGTFQALLQACKKPIAAPSANLSESISCTRATHVEKSLGKKVSFILEDTNPCSHGLESTIIDFSTDHPTLLRHGSLSQETIEKIVGPLHTSTTTETIKAPGQLKRHYAPSLPLHMNMPEPKPGGAFLNFGDIHPQETLNLSPQGNLEEAAANLFKMLHLLDNPEEFSSIAVAPIPLEGLGVAINDRLNRASTPAEKGKS